MRIGCVKAIGPQKPALAFVNKDVYFALYCDMSETTILVCELTINRGENLVHICLWQGNEPTQIILAVF